MQLNDRLIGALPICGGIAVISGTLGFRELPGQQFGSAFFPRIIGTALILTGLAMQPRAPSAPWLRRPDILRGRAGLQVAAALIAVIAWTFVAPRIGFIPTTALLIWALILIAGGRIFPAAVTALAMALLLYVVFGLLLRVPLPFGPVERLLL